MDVMVAERIDDLFDAAFALLQLALGLFHIHPLDIFHGSFARGCFEPSDDATLAEVGFDRKPFNGFSSRIYSIRR